MSLNFHRIADSRVAFLLLALALAGCGASEVGESCDSTGSTDECVEGAVCDSDDGEKICMKICESKEECGSGEDCNGVSGSNLKSCHAEKNKK